MVYTPVEVHNPDSIGNGSAMRGWLRLITLLSAAVSCVLGFVIYAIGRGAEFGWSWGTAGRFLVVSPLFLAAPVVFAIAGQGMICEVVERARARRFAARSCTACGQPLPPVGDICTECGRSKDALWRITEHRMIYARTAFAAVIAACIGASAVEIAMQIDEARFRGEVAVRSGAAVGAPVPHSRARAWPFENSGLVWDPASGFHATD